jgi:hypothetical protein
MERSESETNMGAGHLGHLSEGHQSSGHQSSGHQSSGRQSASTGGPASVVLRATIETLGPAGEAELSFTVKWPAGVLAAAPTATAGADDNAEGDGTDVNGTYDSDGTIRRPASTPSGPVQQ